MHCNTIALHCNTVTRCNGLQHFTIQGEWDKAREALEVTVESWDAAGMLGFKVCLSCNVLQCVAVCCSVLQCVAVCCNVLQLRHEKVLVSSRSR